MVDPNRKINLVNDSDDEDFNDEHIQMVKEYEEEFKDRFTEKDEQFMEFCKQKPKPPVIVYPFDVFHHRGGGRGGGRFNNRGRNFHHQYNRNHHHDNRRNFNNQQGGDNRYHHKRPYSGGENHDNKRFRRDDS